MGTEQLAIYGITPTNLLHTLSGGRSAALVSWCTHYSLDIAHALDVLEGRDAANDALKQALIAYCWLNPGAPEIEAEPQPQVPAGQSDKVVFISDLLDELIEAA